MNTPNPVACRIVCSLAITLTLIGAGSAHGATCIAPDNGSGTADIPDSCDYLGETLYILDGLPPGTSIEIQDPVLGHHSNVARTVLATGEDVVFDTELVQMSLVGTGTLAGFNRTLSLPLFAIVHNDVRTPGTSPQSFESYFDFLQGQITGDPDFDLLRITAGNSAGMPGPGHTWLTQSGSNWAVDSFFDITYRIDFIGAPGGVLSGHSGSTNGTSRFTAQAPVPLPAATWLFAPAFGLLAPWARRRSA